MRNFPQDLDQLSDRYRTMIQKRAVDEVAAAYEAHFEDREWEIYHEPFLNGIEPSLVILHERFGVCLLEVVEWCDDWAKLRDEGGEFPVVRLSGSGAISTVQIPIHRLELVGREVSELYGFRLRKRMYDSISQITVGLVLPYLDLDVRALNSRFQNRRRQFDLFALDRRALNGQDRKLLYPQLRNETLQVLPDNAIADLRNWLAPRSDTNRPMPHLDRRQLEISKNADRVSRRRILGGPGSGKTEALVARAAALARVGKNVLFLTFNITLLNEIRERISRHADTDGDVTILNIHNWAKRVGIKFGLEQKMLSMWVEGADTAAIEVPRLILNQLEVRPMPREFDAVLVDEAQDMRGEWLRLALAALRPHGEFLIAADTGQDIYGAAGEWGPKDMKGLGFSGRWMELSTPFRTPSFLTPFLNEFIKKFPPLRLQNDDRPVALTGAHQQRRLADKISWYQTSNCEIVTKSIELIHRLVQDDRAARVGATDVSVADIAVLVDKKKSVGVEISEGLNKRGVSVTTTFLCSWHRNTIERDLKLEFSTLMDDVKVSTIHSFKGLSASRLVIVARQRTEPSLIYTALSRVQETPLGMSLYVLSANSKVNDFYMQYSMVNRNFPTIQVF